MEENFYSINTQVFQLLEDIQAAGEITNSRGFKYVQANLATLEIEPFYPIMDFVPLRFNYKHFAGELSWYLQKTNKIDFINNFSSFWKDICPNGVCNSNYGYILLVFHPSTVLGNQPEVNQLECAYNSLVKNKDSTQAIAFLNSPFYQRDDGTKDFVCALYLNFFIVKNTLHMKVQMRSSDIMFRLIYDVPWFSLLHQSMYFNLKKIYDELKLGFYYHCVDNIHYYERHFDIVNRILDSKLDSSIRMELKYPMFVFVDGKLQITDEFMGFKDEMIRIVNSGNIPIDDVYWKDVLSDIIKFS